jgi:hypothetical protein
MPAAMARSDSQPAACSSLIVISCPIAHPLLYGRPCRLLVSWPSIAHHDRRRVSHRAALQPQASHTAAGHRKVQLASATNSSGVALSPAEP